jgi:hypothetical protein
MLGRAGYYSKNSTDEKEISAGRLFLGDRGTDRAELCVGSIPQILWWGERSADRRITRLTGGS